MYSKVKDCQEMNNLLKKAKEILQETLDAFEEKHTLANLRYAKPFKFHIERIRDILDDYLFTIFKIEDQELKVGQNGFVEFGLVAHGLLKQQSQYASRYIDGVIGDSPNLGEGLRFKGDPRDYHFVKIHKDDIAEFVKRVREYKSQYQ